MNHIAFPSIGQFRDVIKQVKSSSNYHTETPPKLVFVGTVKLHGTNHSVCQAPEGIIYSQSRERITTVESDNAGSAIWTEANKDKFTELFARILAENDIGSSETIQVYGEWCGGSVQKGVGLNHLPKMFVVCAIRISENSDSQVFLPLDDVEYYCLGLFTYITEFQHFYRTIDFSFPELAQADLINLTEEVERDCPVARQLLGKHYDKELIGEGIVWTTVYKGDTLRFKVKGEKHSSSKVKVLAAVDVERITSVREFAEAVVTQNRMTQGLEHVESRDPANTGVFVKWVMGDIIKEELDTMVTNGFTTKEIAGPCSAIARKWFLGFH